MTAATVTEYRHRTPSAQEPDTRPGDYYVSVRDLSGRYKITCGPFPDDHPAALAAVESVREAAERSDHEQTRRLATWGAWGTCRMPDRDGPTLNLHLVA